MLNPSRELGCRAEHAYCCAAYTVEPLQPLLPLWVNSRREPSPPDQGAYRYRVHKKRSPMLPRWRRAHQPWAMGQPVAFFNKSLT